MRDWLQQKVTESDLVCDAGGCIDYAVRVEDVLLMVLILFVIAMFAVTIKGPVKHPIVPLILSGGIFIVGLILFFFSSYD